MLSAGDRGGSESSEAERFPVGWVPRDRPLRPIGVAAVGDAAIRMVERLKVELARAGSAPPAPLDPGTAAAPGTRPPSAPGPQDPPAPSGGGRDSNAAVSDSSAGGRGVLGPPPSGPVPPRPAQWRGVGGPGWVVLVGDDPPWVDGAVFLGRDLLAPRLLVPTHSAPEAAGVTVAALVDQRVAARCAGRAGPYAVVPGLGIVPLGAARPIDLQGLARWRAR